MALSPEIIFHRHISVPICIINLLRFSSMFAIIIEWNLNGADSIEYVICSLFNSCAHEWVLGLDQQYTSYGNSPTQSKCTNRCTCCSSESHHHMPSTRQHSSRYIQPWIFMSLPSFMLRIIRRQIVSIRDVHYSGGTIVGCASRVRTDGYIVEVNCQEVALN